MNLLERLGGRAFERMSLAMHVAIEGELHLLLELAAPSIERVARESEALLPFAGIALLSQAPLPGGALLGVFGEFCSICWRTILPISRYATAPGHPPHGRQGRLPPAAGAGGVCLCEGNAESRTHAARKIN